MNEGWKWNASRKVRAFFLAVLAVVFLQGCTDKAVQEQGAGDYRIYCQNVTGTALDYRLYHTEETEMEPLVSELWGALCSTPDLAGRLSVVQSGITLMKTSYMTNNLNLYFNSVVSGMDTVSQLLFRAAVVRTLTQIPDIDTITFFVDESPLTGAGYTPLGAQSASDYVDLIGRGLSASRKTTMVLYYANQSGTRLKTLERSIVYESSYSLERDVVDQLMKDIPDRGCYATLPSTVHVISVNEKDGTCYLNFDSSFLTDVRPISGYTILYSVVNSLCELPGIQRVQFMVEGESEVIFKEDISLMTPFTRDLNYLEQ